jgi:GAF domain-containing protein/predicted RNA-binding Zn-ribbon protein involved in translation (DUF1610 family)
VSAHKSYGDGAYQLLPMAEKDVSEQKINPVFDEQPLAHLLEAAFVLQEENRELQKQQSKLELDLELQREKLGAKEDPVSSLPVAVPTVSVAASAAPPLPEEKPVSAPETVAQPDYTVTLAQIVETQHQIQARHLKLEKVMSLVTERVTQLTRAGGAAIGLLDGKNVVYRAAAGSMALPVGTEVPVEEVISVASLKTGQVIRSADVNLEFLFDPEECRRRGIQSLIAVPVYHDGRIAGGLELYYSTTGAFTEQDVHTCQLMAGLVTEALARNEERAPKRTAEADRAAMVGTMEKLKPSLAAVLDTPEKKSAAVKSAASSVAPASVTASFACRNCGHTLVGQEQFCGKCGTPRGSDYQPPKLQAKTASVSQVQEAAKRSVSGAPATSGPPQHDGSRKDALSLSDAQAEALADLIAKEMPDFFAEPEPQVDRTAESTKMLEAVVGENIHHSFQPNLAISSEEASPAPIETNLERHAQPHELASEREPAVEAEYETDEPSAVVAPAKPGQSPNWTSAAAARDFLEQLAPADHPGALARFWNARRGDIYLAIAVILVAAVIRWGIWSNHSVSATGAPTTAAHGKGAPDSDLSMFDRMLISLGLAEAPAAQETKGGNPDAEVWVDLHTALYYCAGDDLYNRTPKGKFTTQRDAQLDRYEPAYRKACD